ncbi:TIR domain-containing protein, partial [Frankia sp. Cas3]|uniref:nSTAND1 domain-containing NTPase n=1 Tax=Frankia sp. Cas3 TaxID=3073926 RepID=UPI002AD36EDF
MFISHASADRALAVRIRGWLCEAGHTVFLDADLHAGLQVGDALADRLFAELYRADALVAVVTAAFETSQWCAAEVGIARANGLRLLPVRVGPAVSHRLVSTETHWTELTGDGTKARKALVEALRQLDSSGGPPWSAALPVYPGLPPFEAGQARVFFGRRQDSRRLAKELRAPAGPAGGGLLAVVGPSGCGKSSLLRAGLGPLLAAEADWLVLAPLRPTDDPYADPTSALARLLAAEGRRRTLGWSTNQVAVGLNQPGGLAGLVADLLADAAPARHLLLIVDQAEELFTRTGKADLRRFAALLADAAGGPVRTVVTIRSEFLDPLSSLAAQVGLPLASFVLRPLSREALPLVITGPARHAGITVEDELVARMIDDTGGGDALPLLAFVLNQLAKNVTRGGALSGERYTELGGVHGALAGQADVALADAAAATGRGTGDVLGGLLRLVTIDDAGQVTRRRAELASLPGPVRTELDVFVARRLLTIHDPAEIPGAAPDSTGPVIDIAHEQIFTAWPPLAAAVTAHADSLRLRSRATDAAADWHRTDRPASHLWDLSRASTALHTLNPADLTPATRTFLAASRRHGQRRRLRATAILTTLLLLATTGGIIAWIQRADALRQQKLATARSLVTQAEQLRSTNIGQALKLNLAAEKLTPNDETRNSLAATLINTPLTASIDDDQYVTAAAFSP